MDGAVFSGFVTTLLTLLAVLFVCAVGLGVVAVAILFVIDVTQSKHAIRRNFPVIGRLRWLFEDLGKFFRQYFFAMEREEMPFNREQRSWVYRAAKDDDSTVPFGSTADLHRPGTLAFVNTTFPALESGTAASRPLVIGPDCPHPFEAKSFFNISAMSYGAISKPAVQALSAGARMAECWLNTGEGGLSPWHLEGGADVVFQIGTACYGVRDEAGRLDDARLRAVAEHPQVRMIEIKLAQGAKPGKGGILPAVKVTDEIAAIRGIPANVDSISPNRHPAIANTPELLDFVDRVRCVTGKPTGLKLVVGDPDWLDELCMEVNARGIASAPDFLTIDSGDGGTGAAPLSLIDNVGMLIQESAPIVVDKLIEHGLRDRVRVVVSGKLILPADVAWALCVGADFVNSARGFMFALGCIQAMRCNKNTCPSGVATHDPRLQKGLDPADKAVRVASYVKNLVHEVGVIAHSCGVDDPRGLRRHHCRVMTASGRSITLSELYPAPAHGAGSPEDTRAESV